MADYQRGNKIHYQQNGQIPEFDKTCAPYYRNTVNTIYKLTQESNMIIKNAF